MMTEFTGQFRLLEPKIKSPELFSIPGLSSILKNPALNHQWGAVISRI